MKARARAGRRLPVENGGQQVSIFIQASEGAGARREFRSTHSPPGMIARGRRSSISPDGVDQRATPSAGIPSKNGRT
ncbi:MAG TPA: hypothetical protein VHX11_12805 [Acidobacteriaceae bacterium]|nr:hypothetical protein [Acidobacteriaceae bacterium]